MPDSDFLRDPATGRPLQINPPAVEEGQVDPRAIARLFQGRKIAEAEKAMAAAIQFQGLRGYQNALQSGKPAAEALTRYGPMMFYTRPQAFGPAVRAITPPEITPYQKELIRIREAQASEPLLRTGPGGALFDVNRKTRQVTTLQPGQTNQALSVAVEPGIPGFPTARVRMNPDQARQYLATAPDPVRTNAINTALSGMLGPAPAPTATTNAPTKKRLRWNVEKGDFE